MIAMPELLAEPASDAGISIPDEIPEDLDSIRETHTHFFVYCMMQLGAPMPSPTSHWENAKVIAQLSDEEIIKVTPAILEEKGFAIGMSR